MRALVLHGPGRFSVERDWPEPQPKPGWAVVKVSHAGICGSDLPRFAVTGSYHHPMVLGHEFAGNVLYPAPGSSVFRGGEPVAILPLIPCGACEECRRNEPFHCAQYQFLGSRNDGGFAEYCLVPEQNLLPLPTGVEQYYGAMIEPLAVALHVVRRSGLKAGQQALVFGAGPIGLLVGLWLQVFGAGRVVLADVRPESLATARELGLVDVVNPTESDFTDLPAFDVTIEAAGAQSALLAAIAKTVNKGTVAVVGRDTKDTTFPLKTFESLMRREVSLYGCWGYNLTDDRNFVLEMLHCHRFPLDRLITHTIGLDEAPATIRAMADRSIYYCKVMIRI